MKTNTFRYTNNNTISNYFLGNREPIAFSEKDIENLLNRGMEIIDFTEGNLLSFGIAIAEYNNLYFVIREIPANCWQSVYYIDSYSSIREIPNEIFRTIENVNSEYTAEYFN